MNIECSLQGIISLLQYAYGYNTRTYYIRMHPDTYRRLKPKLRRFILVRKSNGRCSLLLCGTRLLIDGRVPRNTMVTNFVTGVFPTPGPDFSMFSTRKS